jgi:alkylhydroperoxidase/carboxymuconolactone decarboxylase family protein YurZ
MAITEAACRHHDELFPGHVSSLAITDPELREYFDNFAFDEVLQHGSLEARTRLIVQLAALIAGQTLAEYRTMLGAALTIGVTPVEVKEIVYQAVPYVGMAKVHDFLHTTNEVLTERGIELPLAVSPPPRRRPGSRGAGSSRARSSVTPRSTPCTPPRPPIWRTFSATCRATASVIT